MDNICTKINRSGSRLFIPFSVGYRIYSAFAFFWTAHITCKFHRVAINLFITPPVPPPCLHFESKTSVPCVQPAAERNICPAPAQNLMASIQYLLNHFNLKNANLLEEIEETADDQSPYDTTFLELENCDPNCLYGSQILTGTLKQIWSSITEALLKLTHAQSYIHVVLHFTHPVLLVVLPALPLGRTHPGLWASRGSPSGKHIYPLILLGRESPHSLSRSLHLSILPLSHPPLPLPLHALSMPVDTLLCQLTFVFQFKQVLQLSWAISVQQ